MSLDLEGGCYCGAVRYRATGDPLFKGQCHCRECQYIAGGAPNIALAMPRSGFAYTKGEAKGFRRSDLEDAATREFCPECGTHLLTRTSRMADAVILKVGTLDDPSAFEGPQIALYTSEAQPYHGIPEGIATFERLPG